MIIPSKQLNIKVRPHRRKGQSQDRWLVDVPAKVSGNGKRVRRFFDTKTEAEQFRTKVMIDLRKGVLNTHTRTSHVAFGEAVQQWHAREIDRIGRGLKRPKSLEKDLIYLKSLLPVFGPSDIAHIGQDAVGGYQTKRLEAGKSPVTINSEVRTLKAILNWTRAKEWIDRVPPFEMLREPRKKIDLPTMDELNLIRSLMPRQQAVIVRLIVETGCRQSEAFQLRWKEVDFDSSCIHLYEDDVRKLKNDHSARTVPISSGLASELRNLPCELDWVFPNRKLDGHTMNIQKSLTTAVNKAGIKRDGAPMKLTVKMLRKFYVTWQEMRELDPRLVQRMIGHAPGSKVTDKHYLFLPESVDRTGVLNMEEDVVAKVLATRSENLATRQPHEGINI